MILRPVTSSALSSPVRDIIAQDVEPGDDIPDTAIYAGGYPIPDPSGTGYLTYGVST